MSRFDENTDLPEWYTIALDELGTSEVYGKKNNPRIVEYHQATTLKAEDDETSWCSAFVCWCLEKAGVKSTKSAAARSYLSWGKELEYPVEGCIVVLKRGNSSWQGHVGFFVREDRDTVSLLGGNQGDTVSIAKFSKSKLLGYRWPETK